MKFKEFGPPGGYASLAPALLDPPLPKMKIISKQFFFQFHVYAKTHENNYCNIGFIWLKIDVSLHPFYHPICIKISKIGSAWMRYRKITGYYSEILFTHQYYQVLLSFKCLLVELFKFRIPYSFTNLFKVFLN